LLMPNFLTREEVLMVVIDTFLPVNGCRLTLTDDAAFGAVMWVVQGQLDKAEIIEELADALVHKDKATLAAQRPEAEALDKEIKVQLVTGGG